MYPNLYYLVRDWFGVELKGLEFLNMFGLMVALSFVAAAIVLRKELQRKGKQGLLLPREETIIVGRPVKLTELLLNAVAGFLFGYKIGGLFFDKAPDVSAQDYIFSGNGHLLSGLLLAALLTGMKWYEKKKQQLKTPEERSVRIWPHDRVGDFAIIALVLGILGAKLFDNLENWDEFLKDPMGRLLAPAGLTFYGGGGRLLVCGKERR
jgi:phosphatidylglycerol---prolipoprotein diacylglyceryl transferase